MHPSTSKEGIKQGTICNALRDSSIVEDWVLVLFYECWHLTLLSVSLLSPHDKLLERVYTTVDMLSTTLLRLLRFFPYHLLQRKQKLRSEIASFCLSIHTHYIENKTKGNKLPIEENNSPVTVRLTAKLILGSVLTWHSYCPASAIRAPRIRKPQKSLLLECTDSKRLSAEKVTGPDVSMCKSLVLIHDTCTNLFPF